ncbi:MAG: hypothetical protein ACXWJF_09645 [Burkholderiaceae bacterium]
MQDIVVLVVGTIGSFLVAQVELMFGLAIAFTIVNFFLFCNVFRIPRQLELTWAAIYLLLIGSTITMQLPGWFFSFGLSVAVTLVVIIFQIRQPSYHGMGWKQINPQLPEWWQVQENGSDEQNPKHQK